MNQNHRSSDGNQSIAATTSDSGFNFDVLNRSNQDPQLNTLESAFESSGKSSASSSGLFRSRGRPRGNKSTNRLTSSQPRVKGLKSSYNDGYRELFNSTVLEIASNKPLETNDLLQESQIGVTVWSPKEKEAFFRSLARRGRQDIRGIATDIGSKSESEVYVYSDLLCKAAANQQIYEPRKTLLDTSKLEAALEVGEDCCAALNLAAEALSGLQQIEEERSERKRHKDLALLTPRVARWVERGIVGPEGGTDEVSQQIPAASLLNLANFLALSKRFFMNSVVAENNWRSYSARKSKSPSMMYTAFSDFHALSISITQRLVQSSLLMAVSRLRAVSASGHKPRSHVRRRDVIAALNVLGMKINAKSFWARAARRCKLRVYDKVRHRQVFGKRYSYMEVERILSSSPEMTAKGASPSMSRRGRALPESSASASERSVSSDSILIEADGSGALSNDADLSATPSDSTNEQDHSQEGRDQVQDAYAEARDQQASRNEERQLWKMLGEDPTEEVEPVHVEQPKGPFPTGRDNEDLSDWMDWVDYAGIWETHETLISRSSFGNDRGFEEHDISAAGLTSSESSLESLVNMETSEEEHDLDYEEDSDGNSVTDIDGPNTLSADNAEHGAGSNGGGNSD